MSPSRPPRVAVVGGGISGLAAAHRLRTLLGPSAEITLLEQRDRLGGVLRTVELAGAPFDVGAEAFLVRRPEMTDLLAELGLSASLTHPTPATATIRAGGRTVGMPRGTLMGVPGRDAVLDGVLSDAGLRAVAAEPDRPLDWTAGSDTALGALLRDRFGPEVVDRIADPLLGGVYAGRVDTLGLRATVPALAAALDAGARSLTEAASVGMASSGQKAGTLAAGPGAGSRSGAGGPGSGSAEPGERRATGVVGGPHGPGGAVPAAVQPAAAGPVFGAVRGGYREVVDALVDAAAVTLRTGVTVRELLRLPEAPGAEPPGARGRAGDPGEPGADPRGPSGDPRGRGGGWRLVLGPVPAPEIVDVDAVLLAVPPPALRRLLEPVVPAAAGAAARVALASSAVVGLAYRASDVAATMPTTSGCLVAADEPLSVKGVTHASTKWAHLGTDGLVRIRASIGRFGEEATLQVEDDELVSRTRADLRELDGVDAEPVAVHVQRWGGGLPQYGVGHGEVVAALESAVAAEPGLAVAGAMLHGVGVPACVGSARAAAERLASALRPA
ncbi:FAD-dependent oxidoreductase [Pseudonocardia nematodicida]|uniref:FAD-dependent oxidoreductase n=1 Tax=Pseudonocardia nematodicida TaxID=1206997 RepID=A0ABV1KD23_9PSEU